MKTLTGLKTTIEDDKVTITGTLTEREFRYPVQQVTVGFVSDLNRECIRHVQLSQEAILVKRPGAGFAFLLEEFVNSVAVKVEPKLTFAPLFKKMATELEVDFVSELDPVLQWQVADTLDGEWTDLPGENQKKLMDQSKIKSGQFVRCKGSSDAGWTTTSPVRIK